MTAAEQVPEQPAGGSHPLPRGASPAVICDWLMDEDRSRFVAEYEAALDEARRTLQLSVVVDLVEHWRGIAVAQSDPAAFRRSIRRWAEVVTGRPSPDDEPFAVTRAKAGI